MKLITRLSLILYTIFLSISLAACSDKEQDGPDGSGSQTGKETRRTVVVYMVATNNLDYNFGFNWMDITEMIKGSANGNMVDDARWIVYHAPYSEYSPRLIEVVRGDTVTLKEYAPGESVTLARMNEVLDDVARIAPAKNYGLVLWSHGSGWVVNGLEEELPDDPYKAKPLSYGSDNGKKMNIATLRAAIKGRGIDYLYFDCCNMGTVEVAYELRDAVDYIVGGPAETPGTGMPYDKNMAYLCDGSRESLIKAAETTFNDYIYSHTCIMSVYDTSGFDRLAAATGAIYDRTPLPHPGETVTNYYGKTRQGNFLDFGEYVEALAADAGLDTDEFKAALDGAVIYTIAPQDYFYSDFCMAALPLYHTSGVATYVFNNETAFTNSGYDTLQWARDVVSRHLHE